MGVPQFTDIISLSNAQISEAIIETENQLFNLRFKKATRQNFKSHEIKYAKRQLAQLKTLLTSRLQNLEQKEETNNLIAN
jgi:large subunit ribosomal protein L29